MAARKGSKHQRSREGERLRRQSKREVKAVQGVGLRERAERERLKRFHISTQLLPQLRNLYDLRARLSQERARQGAIARDNQILDRLLQAIAVQESATDLLFLVDETAAILSSIKQHIVPMLGAVPVDKNYDDSFMAPLSGDSLVAQANNLGEHARSFLSAAQAISGQIQQWREMR